MKNKNNILKKIWLISSFLMLLFLPYKAALTQQINCQWKTSVRNLATQEIIEEGCTREEGRVCRDEKTWESFCDKKQECVTTIIGDLRYSCRCCPSTPTIKPTPDPRFTIPNLQVPIDTVKLSQPDCITLPDGQTQCKVAWVGEYIKGVYEYALGIAGILAAIVLMAGGLIWLVSAGSADRINQAKSLIAGSLTGLFLLVGSYLILYQINPELTKFKPITLGVISHIEGDSDRIQELNMNEISKIFDTECNGQESVREIVAKSYGKVTYDQDKRGQVHAGKYIYLDCSSYVSFILKCANINSSLPAYTGAIFINQTYFNITQNLQPGDLVGWPPHSQNKNRGHVFIYIGDNLFADAHGGLSGRQLGNAVGMNYSLDDIQQSANRNNDGKLYFRSGR